MLSNAEYVWQLKLFDNFTVHIYMSYLPSLSLLFSLFLIGCLLDKWDFVL